MKRFGVWKENLIKIEELNAEANNMTFYAVNEFTDLSQEEFLGRYTGLTDASDLPGKPYPIDGHQLGSSSAAPYAFDWRSRGVVNAVRNQGSCGSCWAFAVSETLASACMISKNVSVPPLSAQQLVDCNTRNGGCNGGLPGKAYTYIYKAGGLNTASTYTYTGKRGLCKVNRNHTVCPIKGYHTVRGTEIQIAAALYNLCPFVIGVDASKWQFYQGGVALSSQCGKKTNHAVQLVGYNAEATLPYWIVRNSWGTGWGDNGYIYLQLGANTCNMRSMISFPIPA